VNEDIITPEDSNHTGVASYESPLENMNGASVWSSPSVSGFNHPKYSRTDDAGDIFSLSSKWSSISFAAFLLIATLHAVSFDLSYGMGHRASEMLTTKKRDVVLTGSTSGW